MVRLSTLFAVTVSMLTTTTTLVAGFSTMPGACRLSGMKAGGNNPHGFAPSTGMTYTLSVQPASAPNTYTVTLAGSGTFTGVVLFAQDSVNGTRFGSFSNIPTGYAPLTTCGDINPASNTLGHNSAAPKNLPMSFTWSDGGYPQPWSGVFSAIVMSGNVTMWFTTSPVLFASTGGVTPSMSTAASNAPMMMSSAASTTTTAAAATPAAGGPMGGGGSSSSSSNMTMSTGNMTMSTDNMTMSSPMATSMTDSAMNPTGTGAADAGTTSAAPLLSGSARVEAPLSLGLVVASLVLFFSL